MRSKTSYFNLTLFTKNLTRFWPIWAVYTLAWALQLPLPLFTRYMDALRYGGELTSLQRIAERYILIYTAQIGVVLAFGFSILAAMAVFSYLYNSRSAGLMHTLPIRREGLFFTSWLSGYCFMLLPNLFIALLTLATESMAGVLNGYNILLWLLIQSGTCFFFFSFATFCAMFTGHILALPAFYGILNFLAAGLLVLVSELISQFSFGYVGGGTLTRIAEWLTPTFQFIHKLEFRDAVIDEAAGLTVELFTGQQYVLLYDFIALALLVWALLLYRRRHVETAGDVIAVSWARPLFKYGFAFCAALFGGMFLQYVLPFSFPGPLPLAVEIILCGIVGCFVAEMLLQKSFKVLHRAWKGSAVMAVVLVVLIVGLSRDLFGLETWVPADGDVRSVSLILNCDFPPYDSGATADVTITDSQTISAVTQLHRSIVDQREQLQKGGYANNYRYAYLRLEYTLSNGSRSLRRYNFPISQDLPLAEGSLEAQLLALANDSTLLFQSYLPYQAQQGQAVSGDLAVYDLERGDYENVTFSALQAQVLAQAVEEDLAAGRLGIHYLSNSQPERQANCSYSDLALAWFWSDPAYGVTHTLTTTITPQFSATSLMRALEELGVLDETHVLLSCEQEMQRQASLREQQPGDADAPINIYDSDVPVDTEFNLKAVPMAAP